MIGCVGAEDGSKFFVVTSTWVQKSTCKEGCVHGYIRRSVIRCVIGWIDRVY